MKVRFLSKFSKDLNKIKDVALRQKIAAIIEEVESANRIHEIKNI